MYIVAALTQDPSALHAGGPAADHGHVGVQVLLVEIALGSLLVGEKLITEEELVELGALLAHIDQNYPIDSGDHPREEVLLDIEFKIDKKKALVFKQARPWVE